MKEIFDLIHTRELAASPGRTPRLTPMNRW